MGSYVQRHFGKLQAAARQIVDSGIPYDVTVGGSGRAGVLWEEMVTGERSSAINLADSKGVETKFLGARPGALRLIHRDPENWAAAKTFLFQHFHRLTATIGPQHPVWCFERDHNRLYLRPLNPALAACPVFYWSISEIQSIAARKLALTLLGRGIINDNSSLSRPDPRTKKVLQGRQVTYTGFHALDDFCGPSSFTDLILTHGKVRIELDALPTHDHGPKFTVLYSQIGHLWESNVVYGNVVPEKLVKGFSE